MLLRSAVATGDDALVQDLPDGFASDQTNEAERRLILLVPDCLRRLRACSAADRGDIQTVLGKITRAQELDLERFGEGGAVRALNNAEELDEYTYLIAGCVGEFWTDMSFRHVPDFSGNSGDEMNRLGRAYGSGLQLMNILRDLPSDLKQGRCYLPQDQLAGAGVSPSELPERPDAASWWFRHG